MTPDRTPGERFLLESGCPALVPGYASVRGVFRRPGALLTGIVAAGVLLAATLVLIQEEDATAPAFVWWAVPVLAVVLAFAATAFGVNRVLRFSLHWFFRSVVTGESGVLHVLPLLLVAITFFFLNNATWQTAGELSGIPLVLTVLLLLALIVAFLMRRGRADLEDFAVFADAEEVRAALPAALRPAGAVAWTVVPLRLRERLNLLLVAVFGKLMVAFVVGLAISAFFVLFGVLTVDEPTVRSWIGVQPRILWEVFVAGDRYTMTAEHVRVAVFLGAFSALYFVVSSASDEHLSRSLDTATNRHLRTCLAVRAVVLAAGHHRNGRPVRPDVEV
ncbi:hypothetical protein [Nakamurella deserti]|uniref:hypothetical protein n=1 Tax=Nakamurella deserti TaxID=2164074 RepID=UPI000DBE124D|nr:hypothetical protein [Nakamurella deserti]